MDKVLLGHGSGGKLTQDLIRNVFVKAFQSPALDPLGDSALIDWEPGRMAFTTDSYTVSPLFFPGGDIGTLSVAGTVNDLAVAGAKPLFLSCGLILEEGFPLSDLERVVKSMADTAKTAGVQIVTGDTKVVEKGSGDGVFVNTAGVGKILEGAELSEERVEEGDLILINGPPGDHGISILLAREKLDIQTDLESDCAPLGYLIERLVLELGPEIKFMRDPTRGGVATVLNEVAIASGTDLVLNESDIPLRPQVRGVCEILGLDPLYLANEGKVVLVVSRDAERRALELLRAHPLGLESAIIGRAEKGEGRVYIETGIGGSRLLDVLVEDQLPRIC